MISYSFSSLGYIQETVPDDILSEIWQQATDTRDPANFQLAGGIEKEYFIEPTTRFENFLLENVAKFENDFNSMENLKVLNKSVGYAVNGCWVNFQKKYEFNPPHNHSGTHSFVIWLKIPYDLNEELSKHNNKNSFSPCNSLFTFYFPTPMGGIMQHKIHVDKTFEGQMVLFPASLWHGVNPFYTSDDYRISIAGNISLNVP